MLGAIPGRWTEADRVREVDRRIATASPGALGLHIQASLVPGLGAAPLEE